MLHDKHDFSFAVFKINYQVPSGTLFIHSSDIYYMPGTDQDIRIHQCIPKRMIPTIMDILIIGS